MARKYLGRIIQPLPGITGVSAGSTAVVNIPVNRRYHRLLLNCTGMNYTGAKAYVPTIVTAGGFTNTTGTVTLTVANGVVTGATYVAGNSAGATTATVLSVPDVTGASNITLTCTAAGTGALGNATFAISGATAGPINPATLITSMRLSVNGVVMRDITPAQLQQIQTACGFLSQYGSLPIWFTEPGMNLLRDNALTSWDLFGQSTFEIQFGISGTVTNPGLTGTMEFDYNRNARPVKTAAALASAIKAGLIPSGSAVGTPVPFLMPVVHHSYTIPINTGSNSITTIPWANPIRRLWLTGATPGNIYSVEVQADGNTIFQATAAQLYEMLSEYGFQIGNAFYAPLGQGGGMGDGTSGTTANPNPVTTPNGRLVDSPWLEGTNVFPVDAAIIFDLDGRIWKSLPINSSLVLKVGSNATQNLTVISETLTGAYSG